jgi:hypothetical protein
MRQAEMTRSGPKGAYGASWARGGANSVAIIRRVLRIVFSFIAVVAPTMALIKVWLWAQRDWGLSQADLILIAVNVALALLGISWLWWRLPKLVVDRLRLQIRDPKARTDVEDSFRKTIGQAIGGVAVLGAAIAGYWEFTQQQRTATRQIVAQQEASRNLLISNQVSKGFEDLGNDKQLMTRMGGIYALEGVMKESDQYYQPVLDALCAFVRDSTTTGKVKDKPAADVQAALTVIGQRQQRPVGAAFIFGITGFGATYGNVNLEGANIPGADLHDAILYQADLRGARLNNANLSGAHLDGADLTDADLRQVRNLTQGQLNKACGNVHCPCRLIIFQVT